MVPNATLLSDQLIAQRGKASTLYSGDLVMGRHSLPAITTYSSAETIPGSTVIFICEIPNFTVHVVDGLFLSARAVTWTMQGFGEADVWLYVPTLVILLPFEYHSRTIKSGRIIGNGC